MNVSVSEFRAGLKRYLALVAEGSEIIVTDRGRPVARVVNPDVPSRYEQLVADGTITPPRRRKRATLPPPIKARGSVSELISRDRR